MKKILTLACLFSGINAFAQFNYNFSTQPNQPYQPLGLSATSVNNGTIWVGENYAVPLGFNFKMAGKTLSSYNLFWGMALSPATDTNENTLLSGFSPMDAWTADRGNLSGLESLSPIRYQLDGVNGSRIFKMEYANIGFPNEVIGFGTMNDSMNVQIWLYEGSNVVELRYGSALVTHPEAYYFNHTAPFISFIYNIDPNSGQAEQYYYLKGNPANPTIDSISSANLDTTIVTLTGYPASGTVYRFSPKPTTAIKQISLDPESLIYPTVTKSTLNIETAESNLQYRILSITGGNTIAGGKLNKGKNVINLNDLAPSIYVIQLRDANTGASSLHKIVKQ